MQQKVPPQERIESTQFHQARQEQPVQVQEMRQVLPEPIRSRQARENSLGREAVQVRQMPQVVQREEQARAAFGHAQQVATVQMPRVPRQPNVQNEELPQPAHGAPLRTRAFM